MHIKLITIYLLTDVPKEKMQIFFADELSRFFEFEDLSLIRLLYSVS